MVSGQYKLTSNHRCVESWLCPFQHFHRSSVYVPCGVCWCLSLLGYPCYTAHLLHSFSPAARSIEATATVKFVSSKCGCCSRTNGPKLFLFLIWLTRALVFTVSTPSATAVVSTLVFLQHQPSPPLSPLQSPARSFRTHRHSCSHRRRSPTNQTRSGCLKQGGLRFVSLYISLYELIFRGQKVSTVWLTSC